MNSSSDKAPTFAFPLIPGGDAGKNLNKYFLSRFDQWESDAKPWKLSSILKAHLPIEVVQGLVHVLQEEKPAWYRGEDSKQIKERICQAIAIGDLADFFYKRNGSGWEFWDDLSDEATELSDNKRFDANKQVLASVAAFVHFVVAVVATTHHRGRTSTHPVTIWRWVAWALRAEDARNADFMKENCDLAELGLEDDDRRPRLGAAARNATRREVVLVTGVRDELVSALEHRLWEIKAQCRGEDLDDEDSDKEGDA